MSSASGGVRYELPDTPGDGSRIVRLLRLGGVVAIVLGLLSPRIPMPFGIEVPTAQAVFWGMALLGGAWLLEEARRVLQGRPRPAVDARPRTATTAAASTRVPSAPAHSERAGPPASGEPVVDPDPPRAIGGLDAETVRVIIEAERTQSRDRDVRRTETQVHGPFALSPSEREQPDVRTGTDVLRLDAEWLRGRSSLLLEMIRRDMDLVPEGSPAGFGADSPLAPHYRIIPWDARN